MPQDPPTMERTYKSYKALGARPPPPIFHEVSATAFNFLLFNLGKLILSCAYLLTFGISNYNKFHDKYSVVTTTLAYSKCERFTYLPTNCKKCCFGEKIFFGIGSFQKLSIPPAWRKLKRSPLLPQKVIWY